MILLGKVAMYAGLFMAVAAAGVAFWSASREDRRDYAPNAYWLTVVVFAVITAACLVLLIGFIAKDYGIAYVAENSSPDMSLFYRIAAFWAGQEGSLLTWLWMLAGMSALIAWRNVEKDEELVTLALGVLNVVAVFFLIVLVTQAGDPFKVSPPGEAIGRGINPLLLHWAMVVHPPTLFVGYAGLTIPFAFAIATLLAGDASRRWLALASRWSVVAWFFLSVGIFLGALWAYVVLGWGGFWGWDPVENSSFIPWLTATAMLHSFTVWRRRNAFKFWALGLAGVTFFLTILATYVTRSGIIQSAHTFPGDAVFKILFEVFMVLILATTAGLLIWRRHEFHSPAFGDGEDGAAHGFFNKEFMYYLNNVVMSVVAAIITYATLAPAITRLFGEEINYKPEFYNALAAPISVAYMVVLALCPVVAWKKNDPSRFVRLLAWPAAATVLAGIPIVLAFRSNLLGMTGMLVSVFVIATVVQVYVKGAAQKAASKGIGFGGALVDLFRRNRSQTGGYLVHIGIGVTMIGIIGSMMYATTDNIAIGRKPGSKTKAPVSGMTVEVVKLDKLTRPRLEIAPSTYVIEQQTLTLKLTDTKSGRSLGRIKPMLKAYQNNMDRDQGPSAQVDIRAEPTRDVFVIYEGQVDEDLLKLQVKINPLISLVWLGSIILIIGTGWAAWPPRRESAAAA